MITCTYIDRNQNLWVGTDGGGIAYLDLKPPKFNLFPLYQGDFPKLKNFFTKCFYEDDKQNIWVGTHNGGFSIINPKTLAIENFNQYNGKLLGPVGAIFKDKDGQMWIGHSMGLMIFDQQKNSFREIQISKNYPLSQESIFVNDIKQLPSGAILVATQWGILVIEKINNHYRAQSYYRVNYFGVQMVSIAIGKSGKIWLSSPNTGLLQTEWKDSLSPCVNYFKGVNIKSVTIDNKDEQILWLATVKGLVRFDAQTEKYSIFTEKDGLSNSYIYGVLQDEHQNLWLSSNGGLIYFDPSRKKFQNYNVNDGLQSNEFNTGAFYKGTSGLFYFGGIKGFNWFDPNKTNNLQNKVKPKVAITSLLINDELYPQNEQFTKDHSIRLPYNKAKLTFTFAVLDFTKPKANKIAYRLQGWDQDWMTTYSKTIVYQNLAPGDYTLQYKGINGDLSESEILNVRIHISLPFWKSWWFMIISLLLIAIIFYVLLRMFTQRAINEKVRIIEKQKAVEEERNRISKDMHDEIGSGLTHIALISELVQTQYKTEAELRNDVGNISQSARKLVASMSEIIWALNPQNDTFDNLLAYLREQTITYFEPFDLNFEIDFPDKVPAIKLSNVQRRNLFLVAKEALNNALKYAQANHILMSARVVDDREILFRIQDNGKGFDIQKLRRGANGLHNMNRRMLDIGGTLSIQSNASGTIIDFAFTFAQLTV